MKNEEPKGVLIKLKPEDHKRLQYLSIETGKTIKEIGTVAIMDFVAKAEKRIQEEKSSLS